MVNKTLARSVASLSAVVAAAALLTGCSSGASAAAPTGANLLTYTGSDRTAQLVAAANAEGSLNWTTSYAGPVVDAITAGFKAAYPNITVTVNRGDEGTIIPQQVQAMAAGQVLGDVFEVTDTGAFTFRDANALAPFDTPLTSGIDKEYYDTQGSNTILVADRISYISFGYNKTLVPDADAPKTLQDLLNPNLKGKLAMETNTTSADWIGSVLNSMGDADGKAFLTKLATQQVAQTSLSGAALMGLVASGQYGGSPSVFHNHEQQAEAAGSQTGWVPLPGATVANVGQVGIFANAAHPAAAMLFIDWLLGPDGEKALRAQQYSTPADKQPFEAWVPTSTSTDSADFNTKLQSWSALQKQLFSS